MALAGPGGVADVLVGGVIGGGLQLGGAADGVDDIVAVWLRVDSDGGGEAAHGIVVAAGRVSRRVDDVGASVAVGVASNFVAGREEGRDGGGDAEDGGNGEENGGAGGRHGQFGEEIAV